MNMTRISLLLAIALLVSACGSNEDLANEISQATEDSHHEGDGHDHGSDHVHTAPHGGMLVEIGDHFANIELLFDADTGTVTLYSLGAHADKPVRLTEGRLMMTVTPEDADESIELLLEAVANPLTGETVGDTSEFSGQHEDLVGVDHFSGILHSIQTQGVVFEQIAFAYPEDAYYTESK